MHLTFLVALIGMIALIAAQLLALGLANMKALARAAMIHCPTERRLMGFATTAVQC